MSNIDWNSDPGNLFSTLAPPETQDEYVDESYSSGSEETETPSKGKAALALVILLVIIAAVGLLVIKLVGGGKDTPPIPTPTPTPIATMESSTTQPVVASPDVVEPSSSEEFTPLPQETNATIETSAPVVSDGVVFSEDRIVEIPNIGDVYSTNALVLSKNVYLIDGQYFYMVEMTIPGETTSKTVQVGLTRNAYDQIVSGEILAVDISLDDSGLITVMSVSK